MRSITAALAIVLCATAAVAEDRPVSNYTESQKQLLSQDMELRCRVQLNCDRDFDKWIDNSLRKFDDLEIIDYQRWGTSDSSLWLALLPESFENEYGTYGYARLMLALMNEADRRGIPFKSRGLSLSRIVGEAIGETVENIEMDVDREYRFQLPSGREVSADPGEYFAYARAAAIEKYRDDNLTLLAKNEMKPTDLRGELWVKIPKIAFEALAVANPKYAKAIREYRANADTRGGVAVLVRGNDAYELGYLRHNLDKLQPDPNPAKVSNREQVCRDLPAVETRIFQNKAVELSEAYDAGQLRRLVGSCSDLQSQTSKASTDTTLLTQDLQSEIKYKKREYLYNNDPIYREETDKIAGRSRSQ